MKNLLNLILPSLIICTSIYSAPILKKIAVEGLVINDEVSVVSSMTLVEGEEFSATDVQNSIKKLYHLGWFSNIEVFITEESDSFVKLLFAVKENPVCESIEISGVRKIKQNEMLENLKLKSGDIVSDAFVHENIRILKNEYADKGYLLAEIDCDLVETKIPGNVIARFRIKEGTRVRIKSIEIVGNKVFKTKRIKRKLKTREKRWFSKGEYKYDLYREHLDTLMMFYHDRGYLDAAIIQDSISYDSNKTDINIVIKLKEGRLYFIGDIFFKGNTIITEDSLKISTKTMKRSKPFSKSKFNLTRMFIGNAYREEGYLWSQVRDEKVFRDDTIDVTFYITEGRPAIVRKVDVVGNDKTRENVVRRELKIFPGQKYKQSRMERSIRDLMQLKFFDQVLPDLRPNADGTIDLIYDVQETENIGQFSAGVMYSEAGIGGNFNVSIPNFRGAGEQIDATVEFSKRSQRVSLGFSEPWIFDKPTHFSIRAFFQQYKNDDEEMGAYYRSIGIEPGIGRALKWPDDYFRLYARYRISYEKDLRNPTFDLNGFKVLEEGFLSRLSLTLTRNDTEIIPQFPNKGSILSWNMQFAGLGGDYLYLKNVMSYDWYFPIFWKFVVGCKSKFGMISQVGNSSAITRNDLFAAGGVYYDATIRGYSEGFLGKYNNHGLNLLGFSTELRFPILERQLYLAGFCDLGNIWDDFADVDLNNLYIGTGFGVRLMLPMLGLLGFDFGWPIHDPKKGTFEINPGKMELHFLMNKGF